MLSYIMIGTQDIERWPPPSQKARRAGSAGGGWRIQILPILANGSVSASSKAVRRRQAHGFSQRPLRFPPPGEGGTGDFGRVGGAEKIGGEIVDHWRKIRELTAKA